MNPTVNIEELGLAENRYVRGTNVWSASNLVQWCKEKEYPIFKLPLAGIDLSRNSWEINCLYDFIYHMKRSVNVDKQYPIILDETGQICDGLHRICKAIVDGDTEIDAIRIENMPCPDGKIEE